jgi:hypothetical protein
VPPPAYLAVVEGNATLERDGEINPAVQNMPFVPGDRLRTADGRVQIAFPDGTAIEVAEYSEVESVSPTRVRLLAGTMDHVRRADGGSQSATYLPQELDVYGSTLDQYGSWQYESPYGYVWYPMAAADWRPYYNGYWTPIGSYGWTWIGADVWAWPTHHYGRWGYGRNRWFWIPGRTWGPAWVSWASAPGYVSWCPLGFDGRPVFALSGGFGNYWSGWTVLPRGNFGRYGYYANRNAVDPRRLPPGSGLFTRSTPPLTAARVGRTNVNNAPAIGTAVPRRPPPAQPTRQPQQPPVTNPPTAANVRPPVGSPQSPGTVQRGVVDDRQPPAGFRRVTPGPDAQVPTHYGVAPRATAPTPPAGYRPPGDNRIQRAEPRAEPRAVPSPPMTPAGPPPRAIAPSAERGSAPMAVPRTPPAGATPSAAPSSGSGAPPPHARPPQAAPQGGSQGGSQGEGQPRAQGRGRPR